MRYKASIIYTVIVELDDYGKITNATSEREAEIARLDLKSEMFKKAEEEFYKALELRTKGLKHNIPMNVLAPYIENFRPAN